MELASLATAIGFRKTLFSDALGRLDMRSSDRVTATSGTTANALDRLLEPGGTSVRKRGG